MIPAASVRLLLRRLLSAGIQPATCVSPAGYSTRFSDPNHRPGPVNIHCAIACKALTDSDTTYPKAVDASHLSGNLRQFRFLAPASPKGVPSSGIRLRTSRTLPAAVKAPGKRARLARIGGPRATRLLGRKAHHDITAAYPGVPGLLPTPRRPLTRMCWKPLSGSNREPPGSEPGATASCAKGQQSFVYAAA